MSFVFVFVFVFVSWVGKKFFFPSSLPDDDFLMCVLEEGSAGMNTSESARVCISMHPSDVLTLKNVLHPSQRQKQQQNNNNDNTRDGT